MNIGIILAAGKGTRLHSKDRNKTALQLQGKPMVAYGLELFQQLVDEVVIVVGAFSDSVKAALGDNQIIYVEQTEQKGTGHAVKVAVEEIEQQGLQPKHVLVGYGDHMMFYKTNTIRQMLETHEQRHAAVTLISVNFPHPNELAWGRIIRATDGSVEKIVEQKEATEDEKNVTEVNAGFYCFDFAFLQEAIKLLKPSTVTGEYYITDLIQIARLQSKEVCAFVVDFSEVGSGVNTAEQLEQTEHMLAEQL